MVFGKDLDSWQRKGKIGFVERDTTGEWHAPILGVTWPEMKLLLIAGVGFFMDAYDLFVLNIVYPIIVLICYPGDKNIPWGLTGGVFKAAANIGNIGGQLFFGTLGDAFGRSFVYGKELIVTIIGVIFMISPGQAPHWTGNQVTYWITAWRIVMGFGIGGDYPMSATVVADRSKLNKRGALLAFIFSNQGWGGLWAAVFGVIVVGAYYHDAYTEGRIRTLDGAWRILFAFGLIPAFAVIYFRLTLAESLKFKEARKLQDNPDLIYELSGADHPEEGKAGKDADLPADPPTDTTDEDEQIVKNTAFGFKPVGKKAYLGEFFSYFSEFRHARILIGTAACWFLLDIAFYGINLNQSYILEAIDFTAKQHWRKIFDTCVGNLIIVAAGYFPGYFFTVAFVERLGRKPIQLMGFFCTGICLLAAGSHFSKIRTEKGGFFVIFTFLQFFFNFGANATTFVIPGEVYPARIRATAFGVSAATGKCGAVIASLGFVQLSNHIGIGDVLLIFMALSFAGIPFTFLIPETKGRDADVVDREELLEAVRGSPATEMKAEVPPAGGEVRAAPGNENV